MKENKTHKIKSPRVYIVKGHTGSYEDYTNWNVKAFLSKKKAKKFKAKCQEFVDWYFTSVSIQESYDNRVQLGLSSEIGEYLKYLLDIQEECIPQGELYDFDELVKEKSPDKSFYEDGLVNYTIEKVKLDLDFNNDSDKYDFVVVSKDRYESLERYVALSDQIKGQVQFLHKVRVTIQGGFYFWRGVLALFCCLKIVAGQWIVGKQGVNGLVAKQSRRSSTRFQFDFISGNCGLWQQLLFWRGEVGRYGRMVVRCFCYSNLVVIILV